VVVSETEQQKKAPWWHAFITPQNIIAVIFAIFAAGGYWQETKYQQLRNDEQDKRMERMERLHTDDRAEADRIYMRRESVEIELRALRGEIQGLRRDLR
jgi:hypothetical protein